MKSQVVEAATEAYARMRDSKTLSQLGLPKDAVLKQHAVKESYEAVHARGLQTVSAMRTRLSLAKAYLYDELVTSAHLKGSSASGSSSPRSGAGERDTGPLAEFSLEDVRETVKASRRFSDAGALAHGSGASFLHRSGPSFRGPSASGGGDSPRQLVRRASAAGYITTAHLHALSDNNASGIVAAARGGLVSSFKERRYSASMNGRVPVTAAMITSQHLHLQQEEQEPSDPEPEDVERSQREARAQKVGRLKVDLLNALEQDEAAAGSQLSNRLQRQTSLTGRSGSAGPGTARQPQLQQPTSPDSVPAASSRVLNKQASADAAHQQQRTLAPMVDLAPSLVSQMLLGDRVLQPSHNAFRTSMNGSATSRPADYTNPSNTNSDFGGDTNSAGSAAGGGASRTLQHNSSSISRTWVNFNALAKVEEATSATIAGGTQRRLSISLSRGDSQQGSGSARQRTVSTPSATSPHKAGGGGAGDFIMMSGDVHHTTLQVQASTASSAPEPHTVQGQSGQLQAAMHLTTSADVSSSSQADSASRITPTASISEPLLSLDAQLPAGTAARSGGRSSGSGSGSRRVSDAGTDRSSNPVNGGGPLLRVAVSSPTTTAGGYGTTASNSSGSPGVVPHPPSSPLTPPSRKSLGSAASTATTTTTQGTGTVPLPPQPPAVPLIGPDGFLDLRSLSMIPRDRDRDRDRDRELDRANNGSSNGRSSMGPGVALVPAGSGHSFRSRQRYSVAGYNNPSPMMHMTPTPPPPPLPNGGSSNGYMSGAAQQQQQHPVVAGVLMRDTEHIQRAISISRARAVATNPAAAAAAAAAGTATLYTVTPADASASNGTSHHGLGDGLVPVLASWGSINGGPGAARQKSSLAAMMFDVARVSEALKTQGQAQAAGLSAN